MGILCVPCQPDTRWNIFPRRPRIRTVFNLSLLEATVGNDVDLGDPHELAHGRRRHEQKNVS
jgi:hypothetical protein